MKRDQTVGTKQDKMVDIFWVCMLHIVGEETLNICVGGQESEYNCLEYSVCCGNSGDLNIN